MLHAVDDGAMLAGNGPDRFDKTQTEARRDAPSLVIYQGTGMAPALSSPHSYTRHAESSNEHAEDLRTEREQGSLRLRLDCNRCPLCPALVVRHRLTPFFSSQPASHCRISMATARRWPCFIPVECQMRFIARSSLAPWTMMALPISQSETSDVFAVAVELACMAVLPGSGAGLPRGCAG